LNDSQSLLTRINEVLAVNTRRTDIEDYLFDFHQGRWFAVYGSEADEVHCCWSCYQRLTAEPSWLGLCESCTEANPYEDCDEIHIDDSWEKNEFKYLTDHGKDRTVWDCEYQYFSRFVKMFAGARVVEVIVDGIIYTETNSGSLYAKNMATLKPLDEYDSEEIWLEENGADISENDPREAFLVEYEEAFASTTREDS
jgi:hypothetical protein